MPAPTPKSWHKQEEPQESPDHQPGPQNSVVKIRLVWEGKNPREVKLPWPFKNVEDAHAAINEWRIADEFDN
jgi:hypothetical protein